MDQQLKKREKKGLGGRAVSREQSQAAQQEPPDEAWTLSDEDVCYETSFRVVEEDSFSDCYIECIIRGEFSEPLVEEDSLLKSLDCLKEGSEQELSQQVLTASSLLDCSLEYMKKGAKQELPQPSVGENSLLEFSEYVPGKKLPPGKIPSTDFSDPEALTECARTKPSKNKSAPEKIVCPESGCTREFISRASLRKHLSVHSPRDHVCAECCRRKFIQSNNMKSHLLTHTKANTNQ